MLNKIVLIGRLTADPALRFTSSGLPVCTFTLAVNRPFKNQQREHEADFIEIVAWRKLAETTANNLGKGRLVAVEGRLQTRNYEAQDGSKRKVSEVMAETIQYLDWPKDKAKETQASADGFDDINIDDVPF